MKCPNCNFVTSNSNDLCTRCGMDLRPRKRELGIAVTNPLADIKELRAKLATQAKAAAEQAVVEKAIQEKKSTEISDTRSDQTKTERSWLSRLFGRAAATAPATVENKEAVSASPNRPLSPFAAAATKPQSETSQASSAEAHNTVAAISAELDGAGLAFPGLPVSAANAAAQPSDSELNSDAATVGDKLGEEIQPDLSLNDFLSELERFQTSADDGSGSDQLGSSDPFEVDPPIPAESDLAQAEELDGFELPDFGLDDSHDLLAGLGVPTSPPPAKEVPSLSAAADDDRPLFDTPPPNPLSASAAGGLSTVEAHEMALDDLIGSMASNQAPAESDDPEEDALFSSLVRKVSDPGDQLDDLALSMEEHIEDAMAATSELADKALFAAELDQFGESHEESNEPLEEDEDELYGYLPDQEVSEDAGLHDDDDYAMSSVEVPEDIDSQDDFDSVDSSEDEELAALSQQSSAPLGATPDVMEFDDDDQILEQQLDEMLGDLVLDVKAVKSAKPAAPKRNDEDDSDESIFIDDDLEISFEIEDEDIDYEEEDSEESAETQATDPARSDQILNQLVEAFNQIDSDTEHRSIAEAPADPLPVRPQIDSETMLRRLREAAQTGSPNLIDELLNQVASGFGIDSNLLREAVNPAVRKNEVELSDASAEDIQPVLEKPFDSVEPVKAGTTFLAAAEPVRQLEAGDDLESLGGELDRELAALMSEGTSIFGEADDRSAPPASTAEAAIEAEQLTAQGIASQSAVESSVELESAAQEPAIDSSLGDELGDLSSELERELALLQAEGTTIVGQEHEAQNPAEALNEVAASSETPTTLLSNEEDLSDLESELESEIAALEADGLTFHAEDLAEEASRSVAPIEAAEVVAPAQAEEEIASLEQALDSELAALLSEGTNFAISEGESHGEPSASGEIHDQETRIEESQISQPDSATEEISSFDPNHSSELLESPGEVAAAPDSEFAPTMTGAFLVSDLTALEQTLDQELAALTEEGMTFAGGEANIEPEEASGPASGGLGSVTSEAEHTLCEEAEHRADRPEDRTAVEEIREEFTPTMTGAFLASDFATLLSTSPEKAKTEETAVETESKTARLDCLPEDDKATSEQSVDISDLEAELDQELALLEAEGFGLSKEDEQSENLQAVAGESIQSDAEQISTDIESDIDIGELEAVEPSSEDEEIELGSLEDLIAEPAEEEKEKVDELPAEILIEAQKTPPLLHSEAENSATATGVFLAADLEAILNSYKVPPRLSDEPLPEEAAPSKECAVAEDLAQTDLVTDSIESIALVSAEVPLEPKKSPSESSSIENATIEAAALEPADQVPVIDDDVLEVEIEEIEEEETSTASSARIPFNPEEVSIEAEDEPAMNFSADEPEPLQPEFSQEHPGEIKAEAAAQPNSQQTSELNGHQAALETEQNLEAEQKGAGLSSDSAETDLDDEIDEDDDDDFTPKGLGEIPTVLWIRALEDPDLDSLEMEIEAVELCEVGPSPKVTMLFDLAEEELAAPVQLKAYVEAIPTSVNRELVDAGLKRAVKRYEKEVHQELTRPRDSANSSDSVDVNVSIDALFSVHSPAALWRRAAALTFDLSVSVIMASATVWFLLLDSAVKDQISSGSMPQLPEVLPGLAAIAGISWLIWTVFNVLPTSESGQTGGQRMFGIAVFDLEGNTPGFAQVFVRTMLEITTVLTGGLGILPGFGKHRRMLHDRLACTVVVQING